MSTPSPKPRFVIVPHRQQTRALAVSMAVLWIVSLVVAWGWATRRAVPEMEALVGDFDVVSVKAESQAVALAALEQELTTLRRSDEISRAANRELQQTLSERDEEIAQLRADVAFYERLVGAVGQRRGLSVHSLSMERQASDTWRYTVTLTQNLNRGAVSSGQLSLQVEGVQAGRLTTLDWARLRQGSDAEQQGFSFRYFQQLEGTVMMPAGFTPHRARVLLRAEGRTIEQAFPWEAVTNAGGSAGR